MDTSNNPYQAPNFNEDIPKLNFAPFYHLAIIFACVLLILFLIYVDIILEIVLLLLAVCWIGQVSCLIYAITLFKEEKQEG